MIESTSGGNNNNNHIEIKGLNQNEKVGICDFELLKVLGSGAYGKVFLVSKIGGKDHRKLYAMKVLKKASIVQKQKTLEHTKTERRVLESIRSSPFLVTLHYAFQTDSKLFLVLGELYFLCDNTSPQFSLSSDQQIMWSHLLSFRSSLASLYFSSPTDDFFVGFPSLLTEQQVLHLINSCLLFLHVSFRTCHDFNDNDIKQIISVEGNYSLICIKGITSRNLKLKFISGKLF